MTLQQILINASAVLDLSATLPTGDELTLRQNYANQAVEDAASTGQFPEFNKEFNVSTSNTIFITLPADFREFYVNPMGLDSDGWSEFPEIKIEERYNNSENYVYLTGNSQSRYIATFNGLTSGMSLSILYQAFPQGMQSLSAICELADPTYVIRKIESYVLYSRGDDRFQAAEARANIVLLNLTGRKMKGPGGQGQVTRIGFDNPLT